jgi:hypothetical protein
MKEVCDDLSTAFGLSFCNRYSSFFGGDYFLAESDRLSVRVQRNQDGDELSEVEFPDLGVLVYVDSANCLDEWKEWMESRGGLVLREDRY